MNEDFISVKDYLKNTKLKDKNYQKDNKNDKKLIPKPYLKKLYTQIESGKFKGKKLLLPSLESTRSTKSIVKACVFNVLRESLRGLVFIEAFGGSCVMAAEALSNEALKAYAIELDKAAFKIASQNAKDYENLQVLNADSFEILPELLSNLAKTDNKIVLYFDPPFEIRDGFEQIYEKLQKLLENINLSKVLYIIFEYNSNYKMPEKLKNQSFKLKKIKKFGNTSLSFYENLT